MLTVVDKNYDFWPKIFVSVILILASSLSYIDVEMITAVQYFVHSPMSDVYVYSYSFILNLWYFVQMALNVLSLYFNVYIIGLYSTEHNVSLTWLVV